MTRSKQNGFTLIELLVVITIIGILAAIALPNYIKAKDKAKEAEVKSACHTIQIALERYATDHSGKYPNQIYGGDIRGWSPEIIDGWPYGCWAVALQEPPYDPLIFMGYQTSYPANAFIDPGEGRTSVIFWTGGSTTLGLGDPRFGFTGEVMGNCLNDPRYLWEKQGQNIVVGKEVDMIYDWIGTQNNYTAMIDPQTPNNPFYGMGGLPQWSRTALGQSDIASGQTINAFWAGDFFYRSAGDFFIKNEATVADQVTTGTLWDFPYMRINRYMLGGYGSPRTQGIDVIRLTGLNGATVNNMQGTDNPAWSYKTHPDFCDAGGTAQFTIAGSHPEVFGGGGRGTAPTFPYWTQYNREWSYGAPDGYKDGIIITLISGSDSQKFD